ncbi:hypothetical protein DYB37_004482 [Aphanomyces astaci]|uniref:Uncharacterized protein n=1 Tax=Aphanomyces astaci TaxID=112090 RepID=A0A418EZJ5_APHAT|nr:hypothetical protein DYB35_002627 [Aphanomyces astaci]RHZ21340.1 hypothetical protein DYB37_004482 [Aphanomyces astaci]
MSTSPSSQPLLTDERHIILTMVRDQQISVDQAERLLIATASHATSAAAALAAYSSPSSGVSAVALTLVEVKATLSLDHGHTWVAADQVELNGHSNDVLTYLIPKGGVDKVQVTARFPAPNKHGQWSHRAFVTKLLLHPAIVRYTFENALGQVTSLDVAFQNPPLAPLPSRDPLTDWFFIDMDHLDDFTRSYAKVTTRPPPLNDSTDTDTTLFVLHSCHKNGPTSSYSVTARTVRLWRSQLNHRLQHPIQSTPTELEYVPLLAISEPNKVEWTAGFDSTRSTLVLLRVKLMYENDVAEDSWVLDWPAVTASHFPSS